MKIVSRTAPKCKLNSWALIRRFSLPVGVIVFARNTIDFFAFSRRDSLHYFHHLRSTIIHAKLIRWGNIAKCFIQLITSMWSVVKMDGDGWWLSSPQQRMTRIKKIVFSVVKNNKWIYFWHIQLLVFQCERTYEHIRILYRVYASSV